MTKKITKPHSFGIWGNTDKPKFWELLEPILKWAEQKKIIPFITTRIKDQLPNSFKYKVQVIESADDFQNIDFLKGIKPINVFLIGFITFIYGGKGTHTDFLSENGIVL